MSYDLKFFRVPDGIDSQTAYDLLVKSEENDILSSSGPADLSESDRMNMERIASVLKRARPALESFEPDQPLSWMELTDEGLALQFIVRPNTVDATVAYFGKRPEEVMDSLMSCAKALADAAGYIAYDPQFGRSVTAADRNEMVAQYLRVDHTVLLSALDAAESSGAIKKPWWKFW